MAEKIPLVELYEAVNAMAESEAATISLQVRKGYQVAPEFQRRARALDNAAVVLATMAQFEDESRLFVAGLMKRYRDSGR